MKIYASRDLGLTKPRGVWTIGAVKRAGSRIVPFWEANGGTIPVVFVPS